jgi:hypothetical protein
MYSIQVRYNIILVHDYANSLTISAAATDASLSPPIAALREIMNEMLSQREKENSSTTTNLKPIRGSRLKSTVGLNITEDEYVLSKLKEIEEKKNRVKKPRMKKSGGTANVSTNSSSIKKNRTKLSTRNNRNKENRLTKDCEIEFEIQRLEEVIGFTDDIMMDDSSDEDW